MAANSIREQIIVYLVAKVGELSSIKSVVRTKQSYSDLQQFAVTQLPTIAVVGRLPVPVEKVSSRTKVKIDLIISELSIDLYTYFQEKVTPDVVLSTLADDIWAKVYSDETMGDLVISMLVTVDEEPVYWDPFVAFRVTVKVKYKHTTGGI